MAGFPTAVDEGVAKDDFNSLVGNLKYNPFVNLLANGNMERTTHGDLQVDYWQESGVTNVRSTTQKKYGGYSIKITPTAITNHSYQDLVNYSEYKGLSISVSVWVYAPDASAVIRISDGVSYTDSTANTTTGAWELLTVTRTIDAAATRVRIELRPTNTTGDFYFDAAVMVLGTGAPSLAPALSFGEFVRKSQVSATEPTWYAEMGDEYFNTSNLQKYWYDGNEWRMYAG